MAKYYEIVVFTAGVKEYADWVIDQIDPDNKIKHRLYREHTVVSEKERAALQKQMEKDGYDLHKHPVPMILKDLSKIGRSLDKTIIVDNIADNFLMQKLNGIFISTWYDDPFDTELK